MKDNNSGVIKPVIIEERMSREEWSNLMTELGYKTRGRVLGQRGSLCV